ncbi:MAG: GDSL-type esterase/lipase family protein [Alphaproteobacteria bacterium]|nr:GDSL-type esterase/lipase family protein [Alphaproteobacteria bacterium]
MARLVFGHVVVFPRYHAVADYGDYTLRRTRPNTEFWHTSPEGSWQFRINAQGFRDDNDYAYAKPDDVLRIVTLGDSNVEGYEVEQEAAFAEVIGRYLRQRGVNAEVLNTGVSGFGTAEQVAFFESEGVRYQPDIVVLGFFANDYEDSVKTGLFTVENDALVETSKTHAPATGILSVVNEVAVLRWLSENSYLYSVSMNALWVTAKTLMAYATDEAVKLEYAVPSEEITDYKQTLIAKLVERLHASVEAAGAKLLVVDIPVRSNWKNAVRDNKTDGNLASSVPDELRPAFIDHSDRFFSTEELFDDYRGVLILHRQKGHYHITEAAHAVIGIEVAKHILEELGAETAALDRPD